MEHHAFISYSSADSNAAFQMVKALENSGISCWIAPRDIPLGSTYAASIIQAIKTSKFFIFVFSNASNESDAVVNEIEKASTLKGLTIIPFKLENAPYSDSLEYYLRSKQNIVAYGRPQGDAIEELVQYITSQLPHASDTSYNLPSLEHPVSVTPGHVQSNRPVKKVGLFILGGIIVLAIGFLLLKSLFYSPDKPITTVENGTPELVTEPAVLDSAYTGISQKPPVVTLEPKKPPVVKVKPRVEQEDTIELGLGRVDDVKPGGAAVDNGKPEKPAGDTGNRGAPTLVSPNRVRLPVVPVNKQMNLVVKMNATVSSPPVMVAGSEGQITIFAYTAQNSPVADATVKISFGGGWFKNSGTTTEIGRTNAQGIFSTKWRSPNPAASGYEGSITVTKGNLTEYKSTILIKISPVSN